MEYCNDKRCVSNTLYKKDQFVCAGCEKIFCSRHIYSRVDEANEAITKNAKEYCEKCYPYKK